MTEFTEIMERYGHSVVPLADWLATDIVRLIELLDSELQSRAYANGEYEPSPCCGEEWDDFEDLDND